MTFRLFSGARKHGPNRAMGLCLCLACVFAALSCACAPELVGEAFKAGDLRPPAIVEWGACGPRSVTILFDEAVGGEIGDFSCGEGGQPLDLQVSIMTISWRISEEIT